jgi:hypothetical protein
MIFRKHDGTLIIINKSDYKNDEDYYNKIIKIKTATSSLNVLNKSDHHTNSSQNLAIKKLLDSF